MNTEKLKELVLAGYSASTIAEELGVPRTTLFYWIKKFNLKITGKKTKTWEVSLVTKIVAESVSISECLRKLKLAQASGNYKTFKRVVLENSIDLSHFNPFNNSRSYEKVGINSLLAENSPYNRSHIKDRLLREGLKQNKCEICGFEGLWQGKEIRMILDHINGVRDDNRIENLRMVCPMCNSQLETHCGKNNKKEPNKCIDCGKIISRTAERCHKCVGYYKFTSKSSKSCRKVERPPYEVLMQEVNSLGFVKTGKKYGVSDNAIRKWIKFYDKEKIMLGVKV